MRRSLTPLWLAAPTRFSGLSQAGARVALAVLALLLVATLGARALPASQIDTGFYTGVVDGVRHGGNYYAVTADVLRAGGYPLRPVFAFALPTLAVVQGALPPALVTGLLYALVVAVAMAWHTRLSAAVAAPRGRGVVTVLLLFALLPMLRPALFALPESWAGLFVALSLAVRRADRWIDSVALGLAAALIRETALLYLLLMLAFGASEGARRESLGWIVAIVVALGAFAAHAVAVAEVVRPLDPDAVLLTAAGFDRMVEALAGMTMLAYLPLWIGAPLVALALFGWASWRDTTAVRICALFLLVAMLVALSGGGDTPHWALIVAPLLLPGLIFAIDALRDLGRTAFDRRRITVTRLIR